MKKHSLVAAIAMLVVSAIVLTSATFAWFSMGTTVGVEALTIGVSESSGLLISAQPTADFATTVTFAQIKAAGQATSLPSTNGIDSLATPVSSDGNGTFVSGSIKNGAYEFAQAATGTYYAFPLYIRYDGTESIDISLDGTTITNGLTEGTLTKGKDAYKAVRVALSTSTSVLASASDDTTFTYRNASGVQQSLATVTKTPSAVSFPFVKDTGISNTMNIQRIMVYIWLEGEDSKCVDSDPSGNGASGGQFQVSLNFSKVA